MAFPADDFAGHHLASVMNVDIELPTVRENIQRLDAIVIGAEWDKKDACQWSVNRHSEACAFKSGTFNSRKSNWVWAENSWQRKCRRRTNRFSPETEPQRRKTIHLCQRVVRLFRLFGRGWKMSVTSWRLFEHDQYPSREETPFDDVLLNHLSPNEGLEKRWKIPEDHCVRWRLNDKQRRESKRRFNAHQCVTQIIPWEISESEQNDLIREMFQVCSGHIDNKGNNDPARIEQCSLWQRQDGCPSRLKLTWKRISQSLFTSMSLLHVTSAEHVHRWYTNTLLLSDDIRVTSESCARSLREMDKIEQQSLLNPTFTQEVKRRRTLLQRSNEEENILSLWKNVMLV